MRALLFLALLIGQQAYSIGPKAPVDPLGSKTEPAVDTTLLAPMKPVILFEHDDTLLTSTIEVVVHMGSLDDPAGKTGLTNILSDLMLRGTKKKSREKFQSTLERLGAALYARPSHDMIVFVGKVIKENTLPFMALLQEALLEPAFSPKEFKDLKNETLAEIAHMKNSNNRLTGLALRKEVFAGTPLERPVAGGLTTVSAITRQDVLDAYKKYFRRGNLVFAAASPLPEKALSVVFTKISKELPAGETPRHGSITPKIPKKPTLVVVHKPDTSTGVVIVGQAGLTAKDPERYTLATGNFSFGSEPLVSRLFKVIRSELGWTYYVGSTYHAAGSLSNQQGFYVISSTPSVEFTSRTILKTLSMWKEYMNSGLKPDELKLAQDSLVNSYPFEFDSAEKRLWQKLYGYLYDVPVPTPEEYSKIIYGIDNSRIKKALKDRQDAEGWLIAIVADKAVVEKQLAEEQKDVPEKDRLVVSKVITPDTLVD